ncbi:Gfo/Idh/MocA family protein [Candidatus Latescibacterota bacterium]
MSRNISRRTFIETGAATTMGMTILTPGRAAADDRTVRIGVVGTGNRGRSLLGTMLMIKGVEFPALCDVDEGNLALASEMVVSAGRKKPDGYSKGDHAFEKLMEREDLDAVMIASPWQWHTPMAVHGMKQGKYVGVEVPAAITTDQCWDLINIHEETGMPCMMMENWSFRSDNLAVLNMVRQGMFGDIVHCHSAHSHDCIDHWFFDPQGNIRWGGEFLANRNCDQYPTHSLGPVLSWLDINCGDYFDYITSTASESKSINAYFARKFGPNHPNAKRKFKQGDIVTSVVRTKKGRSIVINYDMQLPRPYDNRWMLQGTLGIYNEQRNALYIEDESPEYHQWEPFPPYMEKYNHFWYRDSSWFAGIEEGHGGTDALELIVFLNAVRHKTQTPIDVYDSVVMSCIVGLSEKSIAEGSVPVKVPDFTRGKWKTKKPSFGIEV